MKRLFFLMLIFFSVQGALRAQSVTFQTLNFKCAEIDNDDETAFVHDYFLTKYSDHFTSYVSDLVNKTAVISTNVDPIDVLQIFRHLGYEAFYVADGIDYYLSYDGLTLREPKN